ncbi:hypothetical protein VTJ04DRAFT_444 [Mycothermus thermophilus]|uniref:uncharacterized protein n=1 Tax=Humicola insolens TaxID=85995 RepID=UPI003742CD55
MRLYLCMHNVMDCDGVLAWLGCSGRSGVHWRVVNRRAWHEHGHAGHIGLKKGHKFWLLESWTVLHLDRIGSMGFFDRRFCIVLGGLGRAWYGVCTAAG